MRRNRSATIFEPRRSLNIQGIFVLRPCLLASALLAAASSWAAGREARAPHAASSVTRFDARGADAPRPLLLQGLAGTALASGGDAAPEDIARRFVSERLRPAGDMALISTVVGGGGDR